MENHPGRDDSGTHSPPPPLSEEEKGRRFLELIDKQSTIQQSITSKLMLLIRKHGWDSDRLRAELEDLVREHSAITLEINGLDAGAGASALK